MKSIVVFVLFVCSVNCVQVLAEDNDDPWSESVPQNGSKLLVILVDGFRWDYVSLDPALKGFPKIAANGVHAQSVKPIFPAYSYPNWYTITTGQYAESHGMIQNAMYDLSRQDRFRWGPNPNVTHNHWWNQTEPLWIDAERHGVRTAMYFWDGCQVRLENTRASYCLPYLGVFDFDLTEQNTRYILNKALDDFKNDEFRLAFVYYELVDHLGEQNDQDNSYLILISLKGHYYGPYSSNRTEATRQIDNILNDLYDDIQRLKLDKELNVVIVSDHGMTDLTNFTTIFLKDVIDFKNDVEMTLESGSSTQILPKPGKTDKIFNSLKEVEGLIVYKKEDIPESYHYKNNDLVFPILVQAEMGYNIEQGSRHNETMSGGNHGYLPSEQDMHGIMYGFGPAFKRGFTSESIEMVDHYNLFCHLLDIPPHPNNGTISRALQYLK